MCGGEGWVFTEKAIARMNRLCPCCFRRSDDFLRVEITLRSGRWPDMNGLVGLLDMKRVLVGIGIYGDRLDAHVTQRANDSARDGAAVSDQDFGKRHGLAKETKDAKGQKKDLPSAPLVMRVIPFFK